MECLNLAPQRYNLMDLYYVMEQLTALRPGMVQTLLVQNTSVKIKRLFLYMAEKAGHAWFSELDLQKIDTGSGKREIGVIPFPTTFPTMIQKWEFDHG